MGADWSLEFEYLKYIVDQVCYGIGASVGTR